METLLDVTGAYAFGVTLWFTAWGFNRMFTVFKMVADQG